MNHEAFAFFNQQLAAMLRDGIPLEGALRELCRDMKSGPLRDELLQLESDLARGTPLKDAVEKRALPGFYVRMLALGAKNNDLPGTLTMIADHYLRANTLWTRLKGLMVYPFIVIVVSLGLTLLLSIIFNRFLPDLFNYRDYAGLTWRPFLLTATMWIPPAILGLMALALFVSVILPGCRSKLRWRVPGFREASLAQIASAISLMLKNGTTLAEALKLAEAMEAGTPASPALSRWRKEIEEGRGKPSQWKLEKPFPPLFLWLVKSSGEDAAAGFQKASEIYQSRASYRIEMMLYGALPISILLLGQMIFWQLVPMMRSMVWLMNMLGSFGGD